MRIRGKEGEEWLGAAEVETSPIRYRGRSGSAGTREQDVPIESFLFASHLTDRLIASFNPPAPERREMDGGTDGKNERVWEENSESHRIRIF